MHLRGDDSALSHLDFAVLDALAMQFAFLILYYSRGYTGFLYFNAKYRVLAAVFFIGQFCISVLSDQYNNILARDAFEEFGVTARNILELWVVCGLFLLLSGVPCIFSELVVVTIYFFDLAYLLRQLNKLLHQSRIKEQRQVLVITESEQVRRAVERINNSKSGEEHTVTCICITDEVDFSTFADLKVPIYAASDPELITRVLPMQIDDVLFLAGHKTGYLSGLMESFMTMGIPVHYTLAVLNDFPSAATDVQSLGDYKVITNSPKLVSRRSAFAKRLLDIAGGLVGTLGTLFITITIGPIIYIKSPGPIFFSQERIGQNGKHFRIYKFRSMYMDAEKRKQELMAKNKVESDLMFKMDDDPRIIGSEKKGKDGKPKGIGNFIRNTSIDEFPQFFNVLKGDMSLVGTRPPTVDEWNHYAPHHRARMAVKPGITGMWQVSGRSSITDFEQVVELDRKYLENWSVMTDIRILARTVQVVLKHDGAS